ncbi:DUF975 family protein [Lapidilactobacillus mulanensis]|uniref:DUF975 family protein n=1 Tax=Lapidilactobacillus mulanensis TaxID=2485999 RepID=A0ABW4DR72_9LACO|nr:DUF975 family protein [Lapidilactobacillus mulanensis]
MDTFLTRPEIKKRAKATMKGNFGTAFALNWLPMLGMFLLMVILWIAVFVAIWAYGTSASFRQTVDQAVKEAKTTASVSNGTASGGGNYFSSYGSGLIGVLIGSGISFASLEWLRLPKDDVLQHPFKKAFQGFTFKYLLGIIVLYLLTSIAQMIGLVLLVIPGILVSYALRIIYLLYYDQGKNLGYFQLMKLSWQLMRGHKFDLFIFELSFFFWYVGILFTGGLLGLYFYPYHNLAFAAFYDNIYSHSDLVAHDAHQTSNENDFPEY